MWIFKGKLETLTVFDDFEKKRIFGAHNCFDHFLDLGGFKKTEHNKIGKTVNCGNFQKCTPRSKKGGCWNGCRKGVSLPVIHKNCALLKTRFYSVFSNNAIAESKV